MPKQLPNLPYLVRYEIHSLRIPPHLLGYQYLTYAVELAVINPMRVKWVTKDLYRETARHFGTNWQAVERNSRTAIRICWETPEGRDRLREIVGHDLTQCPKTAAFIAFVAEYTTRTYLDSQ